MGIMSRNSRLPERPRPPVWSQVSEDVTRSDGSDVVFLLGQELMIAVKAAGSQTEFEGDSREPAGREAANREVEQFILLSSQLSQGLPGLLQQSQRLHQHQQQLAESLAGLNQIVPNVSNVTDVQTKTSDVTDQTKTSDVIDIKTKTSTVIDIKTKTSTVTDVQTKTSASHSQPKTDKVKQRKKK